MAIPQVEHLTKDYGGGKGIFDLSFSIEKGEVFGFLGPNGAGKTTTIRHILGFIKPQEGRAEVDGLDCCRCPDQIQPRLGYLPGELAFPGDMTGTAFSRLIAELRGLRDMRRAESLIARFELDPSGRLRRMSKGMKQKIGLVCAFMHDPAILVLDEPTSGLDPLMQHTFVGLIDEEKAAGKTILMSSHMFDEVERTCDRVAIIKQGRLVSAMGTDELRHARQKVYKLELADDRQFAAFRAEPLAFAELRPDKRQAKVAVRDEDINAFIRLLSGYDLLYLSEVKRTLEDVFLEYYGGDGHVQ